MTPCEESLYLEKETPVLAGNAQPAYGQDMKKNLLGRGLKLPVLVFIWTKPQVITAESACGGQTQTIDLKYTQNGSIYSPGYPYNYGNHKNCKWLIEAPYSYGQRILIYFTTFDLEDCYGCDTVEVFDGSGSYAPSLSKSYGSSLPAPVYSSGRSLYMQFTSDWDGTGQGFVSHYRALNSSSGCPSIVSGATAGVIYSPNFPWDYPNRKSCYWHITAPWGKMINLNFTRFNLEYSYGSCSDYVEVQYDYRTVKYCGSDIPYSITASGSIDVRFYSDFVDSYSGFMAFYQTGYSFPTTPYPYWTTAYPTTWSPYSPSAASIYACEAYSQKRIFVESSGSASISSPNQDDYYHTNPPRMSCTFQIDTATGYILELSFDDMSIPSCSSCSCGYVKVWDGSSSTAEFLGTYCNDNYRNTIPSTGNHMFVKYYNYFSRDSFRATIRSKKGSSRHVNVAAIVVPLVVAVVLFSIIFVVIKCTTIRRSTGPPGPSRVNDVPLHPLPHIIEVPPTTQTLSASPVTSQSLPPTTELVPPYYPEPFATASDPPPTSTNYSQGVTNMSLAD
ncbi:dorsal-ventral patterning protein tolloid-like [Oculina patagonica]